MAALEPVETATDKYFSKLNLSKFHCVYVSYGSYGDEITADKQYLYPHANPPFLNSLFNFTDFRYLSISIDPRYKKFDYKKCCHGKKKFTFVTIPVEQIEATGKDYLREIAMDSIEQTRKITEKIVTLLDTVKVKYVMFVNFIKFVNLENVGERTLYEKSLQLKDVVGGYDYYDWCGFGPYKNYILKSNDKTEDVKKLLTTPKLLTVLKSDVPVEKVYKEADSIRSCLFPITGDTFTDLYYLFPGIEIYAEEKTTRDSAAHKQGGRTRKRKSKRRNIFITL